MAASQLGLVEVTVTDEDLCVRFVPKDSKQKLYHQPFPSSYKGHKSRRITDEQLAAHRTSYGTPIRYVYNVCFTLYLFLVFQIQWWAGILYFDILAWL